MPLPSGVERMGRRYLAAGDGVPHPHFSPFSSSPIAAGGRSHQTARACRATVAGPSPARSRAERLLSQHTGRGASVPFSPWGRYLPALPVYAFFCFSSILNSDSSVRVTDTIFKRIDVCSSGSCAKLSRLKKDNASRML